MQRIICLSIGAYICHFTSCPPIKDEWASPCKTLVDDTLTSCVVTQHTAASPSTEVRSLINQFHPNDCSLGCKGVHDDATEADARSESPLVVSGAVLLHEVLLVSLAMNDLIRH